MPTESPIITEPINCPQCGYDLRGQVESYCPECNFHYDLPALKALRRAAAADCLFPYLDAIPFLVGAVAIALAGLVHLRISYWPFLVVYCFLVPLLRGYVLQNMRQEFRDDLEDVARAPRWLLLTGILPRIRADDIAVVIAVIASLLNRTFAILLPLIALSVGGYSTWIAVSRHARFDHTNQHLALTPREAVTLRRARLVGVCSSIAALILWSVLIR